MLSAIVLAGVIKTSTLYLALTSPDFITTEILLSKGGYEVGLVAKCCSNTTASRAAFWAGKSLILGFLDTKLKTRRQKLVVRIGITTLSLAVAGFHIHQLESNPRARRPY